MLVGALEGALDGVVAYRAVRDRRGRIVDFEYLLVSEAAARTVGCDPARLIGRRLLDAPLLRGDPGPFDRYVEVVETGRRSAFVHRQRDGGGDGAVRWLRAVAVKLGDGLAVALSDVTDLQAADRVPAEDGRRFRSIFDQSSHMVWLLHPDGRVLEANRAALDYCRLKREDVVGTPLADTPWWPANGGPRRRLERALAAAAEGEHVRYVADVRNAACNDEVMDFSVWPVRDGAGGGVELLVAEGRDVTPRRDAEIKLRQSRSLYQGVFEHIPIGLFLVDVVAESEFVIEALNPAEAALLRVDPARAVGRPPAAVFPAEIAADLVERLRGCVAQGQGQGGGGGGGGVEYEITGRLPGGRRSLRIGLAPIRGEGGAVTKVIGRMMDVTERKQAEEALYHAQKMEAVGQLTGGVAHDFNNLLTVIGGNLELLERQVQDRPEQLHLITNALTAVFRAADLTNQLLAYSRKQRLNPEIVDCNRLVEDLHDLLRRTLDETIEVRTLARAGLWPCEADRGQLQTVLLNLAVNARDAMPDGGTLVIETDNVRVDDGHAEGTPGLRPGAYVAIAVTDTGHGIPPELLDHVFEPFFTTKEVGKGSGLGLSMAYGFAQQSGGLITIYSEPGCGTTLRLYLPRAAARGGADREATGTTAADDPMAGGLETVLVVEDDPEVRRLAVDRLSGLGYRVLQAGDGHAALALLEDQPEVDLLFTDLVMPGGMDGLALAEEARRRRPGLKVLYTTGYPERTVGRRRSVDDGARLISKPYRLAELADKVRRALDG
ncbi:MAG TPA: PAS domain-containing protein [Geminicoccaceae bacterium]|nr:PAS domain-containing protein [Geminicoccaceae bacterium]